MTNSNPDLPSKPEFSSYVVLVDSFDSSFEQQVSDLDEFDFSYEFFNYRDTEFVPADSISILVFSFSSELDLTNYKPSNIGTIDSYFVDSSLTTPFVEYSKVPCVSTKVTCIISFLLNVILMLLFLRDNIFSWIHNCLLPSPCCSICNCIFMYVAHAYELDAGFDALSSLYKPSSLMSSSLNLLPFCLCNLTPFTLRRRSLSVFIFIILLALCLGMFHAFVTSLVYL